MPQDIIYQDPDKPQPQAKGQTAKRTKFLPTLKVIGLRRSAYVDERSQWKVRIFFIGNDNMSFLRVYANYI